MAQFTDNRNDAYVTLSKPASFFIGYSPTGNTQFVNIQLQLNSHDQEQKRKDEELAAQHEFYKAVLKFSEIAPVYMGLDEDLMEANDIKILHSNKGEG